MSSSLPGYAARPLLLTADAGWESGGGWEGGWWISSPIAITVVKWAWLSTLNLISGRENCIASCAADCCVVAFCAWHVTGHVTRARHTQVWSRGFTSFCSISIWTVCRLMIYLSGRHMTQHPTLSCPMIAIYCQEYFFKFLICDAFTVAVFQMSRRLETV